LLTSFRYSGEERWRSEGVQVGGPRSARGVIGTWFDKDYEQTGPVGPTAYWKTEDPAFVGKKEFEEFEEEEDEYDPDDEDNEVIEILEIIEVDVEEEEVDEASELLQ